MNQNPLETDQNADYPPRGYEASLTPEQREELHAALRSNMAIEQVRVKSVPWCHGQKTAAPPDWKTLREIRKRLRVEDIMSGLQESISVVEHTGEILDALIKSVTDEKLLNRALALIGQEVINKTLLAVDPTVRNAAVRLMLKRADQRRADRKLDILESALKTADPAGKPGKPLTPSQKEKRGKQILGI